MSAFEVYAEAYKHDARLVEGPEQLFDCAFGAHLYASDLKSRLERTAVDILPRGLWILHVVDGAALIDFGGADSVRLTPGDTAALSVRDTAPFTNHLKQHRGFKSVVVMADPDRIEDDEIAASVCKRIESTSFSVVSRNHVTDALAAGLIKDIGQTDSAILTAEACAAFILHRCLTTQAASQRETQTPRRSSLLRQRLAQVRDRLQTEPDLDHSLATLAKDAGLGVSTLKSRFPEAYGQSVIAFLRDVRLKRAFEQLQRSELSIAQIANEAGFRYPSNFSTAFRRKFGILPSAVRN